MLGISINLMPRMLTQTLLDGLGLTIAQRINDQPTTLTKKRRKEDGVVNLSMDFLVLISTVRYTIFVYL